MTTTSSAPTSGQYRRQFWITDSAIESWREKIQVDPRISNEALSDSIDSIVSKAINNQKVEDILDEGMPARLVHLNNGEDTFFALVKKSNGRKNYAEAIVTIFAMEQVENLRQVKWSKTGTNVGGLSDKNKSALSGVKPSEKKVEPVTSNEIQKPPPVDKKKPTLTFMIAYIPKSKDPQQQPKRLFEEYMTTDDVETRLTEIDPVPGSLRVFKELPLGLKVLT